MLGMKHIPKADPIAMTHMLFTAMSDEKNNPGMALNAIKNGAYLLESEIYTYVCSIYDFDKIAHNWTPLKWASERGYVDVVRALLERGAKVDDIYMPGLEDDWDRPINLAAKNGHLEIVILLLQYGAKPSRVYQLEDTTPLHFAAWHGHLQVLKTLIQAKADIEECEEYPTSYRALHYAVIEHQTECVQELIRAKADIHAECEFGTPVKLAVRYRHADIVRILIDHGALLVQRPFYEVCNILELSIKYAKTKTGQKQLDALNIVYTLAIYNAKGQNRFKNSKTGEWRYGMTDALWAEAEKVGSALIETTTTEVSIDSGLAQTLENLLIADHDNSEPKQLQNTRTYTIAHDNNNDDTRPAPVPSVNSNEKESTHKISFGKSSNLF